MNNFVSEKPIPEHIDRLIPKTNYNTSNEAIAQKVMEDINFLRDRIERIRKLQTPNSSVLKTYQSMLDSRESVLEWLRQNGDLDEDDMSAVS